MSSGQRPSEIQSKNKTMLIFFIPLHVDCGILEPWCRQPLTLLWFTCFRRNKLSATIHFIILEPFSPIKNMNLWVTRCRSAYSVSVRRRSLWSRPRSLWRSRQFVLIRDEHDRIWCWTVFAIIDFASAITVCRYKHITHRQNRDAYI